jgi:hypothetical protein
VITEFSRNMQLRYCLIHSDSTLIPSRFSPKLGLKSLQPKQAALWAAHCYEPVQHQDQVKVFNLMT